MLRVNELALEATSLAFLGANQSTIDAEPTFATRKATANALWKKKEEGEGATAFQEIKEKLKQMAVGGSYCNYCEQDRIMPTTIEHIRPKSTFPAYAFKWANFTAVCENCNMGFKKAQMAVFSPAGSATVKNVGQKEPVSDDLAFIDPRAEDPMDLMILDLEDFQFYPTIDPLIDPRAKEKVAKTISILHLNEQLPKCRKKAFDHYKARLAEYCKVQNANTHQEIVAATHGNPKVELDKPLEEERNRILHGIEQSIREETHQTVWREMIRQPHNLSPELRDLFAQAPTHLLA